MKVGAITILIGVLCIASNAWAASLEATACTAPQYTCAAGSVCCVAKEDANKPNAEGVCEKECVGVLVQKQGAAGSAALGMLQQNPTKSSVKKGFKAAGGLAIKKGTKALKDEVALFAAEQKPPLGDEFVKKFEAVQKALAARSQQNGIVLDNTMVSICLRCLFLTKPTDKINLEDKLNPCTAFTNHYFGQDTELIKKKLVFWSGSGAQFEACEKANQPAQAGQPQFGVLEKTVFGKVLNLVAELAGVVDWNSPVDGLILGNYFKLFDAASGLYGATVAKQVEANGKATTVYIGTLPAPRKGQTCADASDLFEKTIYVKTEIVNFYAHGSKITIDFLLVSGGPLGGCFRQGAPLPAGVSQEEAAKAMAPTNCDTLPARLDAICKLNDKCKGFQKATDTPTDPLKIQYTCAMSAYPHENGKPSPDEKYACRYPEFDTKAPGQKADLHKYFQTPARKDGSGPDMAA